MKITKQQLKQIIKEEIQSTIDEQTPNEEMAKDAIRDRLNNEYPFAQESVGKSRFEELVDAIYEVNPNFGTEDSDTEAGAEFVRRVMAPLSAARMQAAYDKNPSFFEENEDISVKGFGTGHSVKGLTKRIKEALSDAMTAADKGDYETLLTRISTARASASALKKHRDKKS